MKYLQKAEEWIKENPVDLNTWGTISSFARWLDQEGHQPTSQPEIKEIDIIEELRKYPAEMLEACGGKLPFVMFNGKADEEEKLSIWLEGYQECLKLVSRLFKNASKVPQPQPPTPESNQGKCCGSCSEITIGGLVGCNNWKCPCHQGKCCEKCKDVCDSQCPTCGYYCTCGNKFDCPCHSPHPAVSPEWEIGFEKKFDLIFCGCGVGYGRNQSGLKAFIRQELQSAYSQGRADERREVRELAEEMKKDNPGPYSWKTLGQVTNRRIYHHSRQSGYNQALSDLSAKLDPQL